LGTENHKVNIIKIDQILKHSNADKLEIIPIPDTGYQCVAQKGQFKLGDLAYYIPPDSVVPERTEYEFLWEGRTSPIPVKYRRVAARRFRGEWSEGLLMPLDKQQVALYGLKPEELPGMDIAADLGIVHYEPPEEISLTGDSECGPGSSQNKIFPRSAKGWFYFLLRFLSFGLLDINGKTGDANEKAPENYRPIYDVEAYKNFKNILQIDEPVVVTEKIHGSNARYTFETGFFGGKFYVGSRKLWKSPKSRCIWRNAVKQNPWIEEWCREHPGYTLYGEVVPTQKGFNYGCADGQVRFFLFDVRSPEGRWLNAFEARDLTQDLWRQNHWVPTKYQGPWKKDLIDLADGDSMVDGAKHVREGIVIRPLIEREARNLGRVQLKVVSNKFLEKELKDAA
jgi:RNA ligase/PHA02142 OB-fold domain